MGDILTLPSEIIERILLQIKPTDLIRLSYIPRVNDYIKQNIKQVNNSGEYGKLIKNKDELSVLFIGPSKYFDNECLELDCLNGWTSVKYLIKDKKLDWNRGLYGACLCGNIEILEYLISKGAGYLNGGLKISESNNNYHIVDYLNSVMHQT